MSEPVTLNEVLAAAAMVYRPEAAVSWLDARNKALGGETPRHLVARGDGERVLALLHALAEGAYL